LLRKKYSTLPSSSFQLSNCFRKLSDDKKLNIHTHKTTTYYEVEFIFEISIEGPDVHLEDHRVEEKWFKLTEDADLDTLKAEIAAHLLNAVKPFLDKYK
jgi:hypothetical protein